MIPYTEESYQLLHDGAIAFAEMEANGIAVDTVYLDDTIERQTKRVNRLQRRLRNSETAKVWRKEFRQKTNYNSTQQLGRVLFDVMGHDCPATTPSGQYSTDEKTLASVDDPFIEAYLQIKKMQKILNTYLKGIRREVVDGFLHPFYNLHLARTFRSSCDSPNFQNIPVRDPLIAKLVRRAFIPRPGRRIVELDYSGIEVCIGTCYHADPTMLEYLHDKSKDMHRDMATQCYRLPRSEMQATDAADAKRIKKIRYCGKNGFVFPEFYGDWYADCAKAMWNNIDAMGLHLRDGTSLKQHLYSKGITSLGSLDSQFDPVKGTFAHHMKKVEHDFWNRRFPVYNQWRKDIVRQYKECGWLQMLTGFVCQGPMTKNQIINAGTQGTAFHCLLWSLIRLQKKMKKARMRSLVIGQIHDSGLSDVPNEELQDYLGMAHETLVDDLLREFGWINVPIEIEAEATPVNGSWYLKEEIPING